MKLQLNGINGCIFKGSFPATRFVVIDANEYHVCYYFLMYLNVMFGSSCVLRVTGRE